jgi:serine/threonine protein kinase
MNVGIDPFSASDPMSIYKNILKGKVAFPSNFNKEAKSLVKHLLVHDLTKRYGNLKNGAGDIKIHRWFNGFDWSACEKMELTSFYKPTIKGKGDTSNFTEYPDSPQPAQAVPADQDIFKNW